jgi:hypothetical protein
LLDHEELKKMKNNNPINNAYQLSEIAGKASQEPVDLNLNTGLAKTMMDKIVEHKVREQALDQARNE